ncbi:MAG TPA: hypothetical protein RMI62_26795, partial [Polyangiaceae bacterium LLY-WYZ-15_(1-7)]|nr:hypothetical protein [Polyangiaceae bacterium LLY-WYZ-15_(1-7)]
MRRLAWWFPILALAACGDDSGAPGDGGPRDAAEAADAPSLCAVNADCDDGLFCNGAERCDPGASGASRLGC